MTNYEEGKHVFIGSGVDTALQYGDMVRINALSGEGGSWESEGVNKSYVGGSIELKVKAEEGFKIKDLTVDGVPVSDIELDTFIKTGAFALTELTGDHEVNVTFAPESGDGSEKEETGTVTETNNNSEVKNGTKTAAKVSVQKSSEKSLNRTVPVKSGDETKSVYVAIAAGAGIALTAAGMRRYRKMKFRKEMFISREVFFISLDFYYKHKPKTNLKNTFRLFFLCICDISDDRELPSFYSAKLLEEALRCESVVFAQSYCIIYEPLNILSAPGFSSRYSK